MPPAGWTVKARGGKVRHTEVQEMPRYGTNGSLARYGPTAAAAFMKGGDEWKARLQDEYMGKGRYSRRLRSYGRRRYKMRPSYRRYGGRGLYTGTGGFWNDWKGRLGAGFKAGVSAMGMPHVANALTSLESAGKAMGYGEYAVNNGIVDAGAGVVVPAFSDVTDTSVTISHREYISDLFGPPSAGQFQNTVYSINPGIERTFPWLSQIAANYEEYTLQQCIFTYRTTVTDFVSTGGQVGTVIMATQYNPSDTPFQSKQDAMEYDQAMSGKVSSDMLHGVECDPAQNSGAPGKYVRAGPPKEGDDLKNYDWANLNLCVCNIPSAFANQALGEIWVSYTVTLRKPKFFVSRGLNILRDTFVGQSPEALELQKIVVNDQYAYGQQNRIGGDIITTALAGQAPLDPAAIRYVFPATFSGNVIIKLSADNEFNTGDAAHADIYNISNLGLGIKLINDIYSEGGWTSKVSALGLGTLGTTSTTCEIHLSIATPTSAGTTIDNYVDLTLATAPGALQGLLATSFHVDVAMYNTQFNYPASGNVIVVNPVTLVQEQWP